MARCSLILSGPGHLMVSDVFELSASATWERILRKDIRPGETWLWGRWAERHSSLACEEEGDGQSITRRVALVKHAREWRGMEIQTREGMSGSGIAHACAENWKTCLRSFRKMDYLIFHVKTDHDDEDFSGKVRWVVLCTSARTRTRTHTHTHTHARTCAQAMV